MCFRKTITACKLCYKCLEIVYAKTVVDRRRRKQQDAKRSLIIDNPFDPFYKRSEHFVIEIINNDNFVGSTSNTIRGIETICEFAPKRKRKLIGIVHAMRRNHRNHWDIPKWNWGGFFGSQVIIAFVFPIRTNTKPFVKRTGRLPYIPKTNLKQPTENRPEHNDDDVRFKVQNDRSMRVELITFAWLLSTGWCKHRYSID